MPKPEPRKTAQHRRGRAKSVRLGDYSVEALKEQQAAFREKFGREPGPDDPIFFDPEADEPRPIQEANFVVATIRAMRAAGINPAMIYAFEKTGMLITEDNMAEWSDEDMEEWNAALHEYELKSEGS